MASCAQLRMVSTPISCAAMLGIGTCFSKCRKSAMSGSSGRHLQRSSGFGCRTPALLPLHPAARNASKAIPPISNISFIGFTRLLDDERFAKDDGSKNLGNSRGFSRNGALATGAASAVIVRRAEFIRRSKLHTFLTRGSRVCKRKRGGRVRWGKDSRQRLNLQVLLPHWKIHRRSVS